MKNLAIITTCIFLLSCTTAPIFPPEVTANVDHALTFAIVKASPDAYKGRTIEFGGQILKSRTDGHAIHILVRELPIRTEPFYGPVDSAKLRGMFVVTYQGEMTAQDLQDGNMLLVVGTVLGTLPETITDLHVRRPTVQAECVHIWRTQGHQIDDFPWIPTARYWPLVEQTFCVNTPATLLKLS